MYTFEPRPTQVAYYIVHVSSQLNLLALVNVTEGKTSIRLPQTVTVQVEGIEHDVQLPPWNLTFDIPCELFRVHLNTNYTYTLFPSVTRTQALFKQKLIYDLSERIYLHNTPLPILYDKKNPLEIMEKLRLDGKEFAQPSVNIDFVTEKSKASKAPKEVKYSFKNVIKIIILMFVIFCIYDEYKDDQKAPKKEVNLSQNDNFVCFNTLLFCIYPQCINMMMTPYYIHSVTLLQTWLGRLSTFVNSPGVKQQNSPGVKQQKKKKTKKVFTQLSHNKMASLLIIQYICSRSL